MCQDGKLKDDHTHIEIKGLKNALYFLKEFKTEWIRVVLNQVHKGKMWLDEPIKITKDVIQMVTDYPTNDKEKNLRHPPRTETEKLTGANWDGRGMRINTITDLETRFGAYVITYKIFQSRRPNNVPCRAVDITYKVVRKGLQLDLTELMLKQLEENMRTICVAKINTCKFGSLLVCKFLYLKKQFSISR